MAYTTPSGVTYTAADKTALWLIENQDSMARSLTSAEKAKIATYMARPASERAAIEQAYLGHTVSGGSSISPPTGKSYTETTDTTGASKKGTIDIDISKAIPYSELPPATGEERFLPPTGTTTTYTAAEEEDYSNYVLLIDLYKEFGVSLPVPKDKEDYFAHADEWASMLTTGEGTQGYTIGDVTRGYTPDQLREYKQFLLYASAAEAGDWKPAGISDYLTNYDKAQQMLAKWKPIYEQGITEQEEYEQYIREQREHALPPEEARRRQEEAYAEGRVAAGERYREPTRYPETYEAWLGQQGQFSGALERFAETQYPSLQRQFEAGMPQERGYATPTEARAAALQRESMFQAWLPQQEAGMYQDYMGQRPAERGERLFMQAPRTRTVNW